MRFLEYIDSDWIANKTHELVAIRSETLSEGEMCEFYASELESLGLVVERRYVSDGRFNVYAKLKGSNSQKSLIFNGHLDTIPIGESWPPRISEDKIFGRGAEDMKGGMAAVLAVLRAFKMSDTILQGDLWITAVVGHEDAEAEKLIEDAKLIEKLGCFALVLEKIPAHLAQKVAESISIPVIGIGAGSGVDGQVLVIHDMLGMNNEFSPRFLRRYLNLYQQMTQAIGQYVDDVKSKDFPNASEQY